MSQFPNLSFLLTLAAALGCGLVAGIFLAFSNFVMSALERLPANAGAAAMQSINLTVLNPLFLGLFFGTTLLSLALGAIALLRWQPASSPWLLAGAALYVAGSFLVTALGNVPLNKTLAALDPATPEAAAYWVQYVARWGARNHLRTLASALAASAFSVGLARLS